MTLYIGTCVINKIKEGTQLAFLLAGGTSRLFMIAVAIIHYSHFFLFVGILYVWACVIYDLEIKVSLLCVCAHSAVCHTVCQSLKYLWCTVIKATPDVRTPPL